MAKNLELNGMIHGKFGSETAMAHSLQWSRQRLNKITNGRKLPDLLEVNAMAEALDVSFIDLANIFLGKQSTYVDTEKQIAPPIRW